MATERIDSSAIRASEHASGLNIEEQAYIEKLRKFSRRRRAAGPVACLSLLSISSVWIWGYLEAADQGGLVGSALARQLLFASYILMSVSMWAVYFLSSRSGPFTGVKTLRRLLLDLAEAWDESSSKPDIEFAPAIQDKARASMTMLAMLSAGSALLMTRALDRLALPQAAGAPDGPGFAWDAYLPMSAAAASAIALVCFIVSVDSLDVLFNRFSRQPGLTRNHLAQYFYSSTRNARYYGVMFLLWAICLFAASYDLVFGAFVTSIVIAVGWSHWFPSPPIPNEGSTRSTLFETIARIALIAVPAAWGLVGW